MNKEIIIKELHKKIRECETNPDISAVDIIEYILDFINKCPDEETIPQKVDKWLPKKEHIDTLFKIYNTRKLDRDDKLVVLDIYNTFLELIGTPRV